MTKSLPDELRVFIEARVNMGESQSARDYLRDLIRRDREEIDRLLLEGFESGKVTPLDMPALQKKAKTLLEKRTRSINTRNSGYASGGKRCNKSMGIGLLLGAVFKPEKRLISPMAFIMWRSNETRS